MSYGCEDCDNWREECNRLYIENAALRRAAERLLKWAERLEAESPGDWLDHACGECVGYDNTPEEDWLCGRHAVAAVLTTRPASPPEAK